jgi:hypothetical protein
MPFYIENLHCYILSRGKVTLQCWAEYVCSVIFLARYPEVRVRSRRCKIFWVVGLERGPISLVSTIEELFEKKKKSSGAGLENREYGRRDPSCRPRGTLYQQTLALTSPTGGCRPVGMVCSWTQTKEFSFSFSHFMYKWGIQSSTQQTSYHFDFFWYRRLVLLF